LFELVVTGAGAGQQWRRRLVEGETARIGRSPVDGWEVAWDMRISREHADLTVKGDHLVVELLDGARNDAQYRSERMRSFVMNAGEEFRIGKTRFRFEKIRSVSETVDDFSFDEDNEDSIDANMHIAPAEDSPQPTSDKSESSEIEALKAKVRELKEAVANKPSGPAKESEIRRSESVVGDIQEKLKKLRAEMNNPAEQSAAMPPAEAPAPEEQDITNRLNLNQLQDHLRDAASGGASDSQQLTDSQHDYVEELLRRLEKNQFPPALDIQAIREDSELMREIESSHEQLADAAMQKMKNQGSVLEPVDVVAMQVRLEKANEKRANELSQSEHDLLAKLRSHNVSLSDMTPAVDDVAEMVPPAAVETPQAADPPPAELVNDLRRQADEKRAARTSGASDKMDVEALKDQLEADAAEARGDAPEEEAAPPVEQPAAGGKIDKSKMSPADIIAAARGGAAKPVDPPATETPKVDKSKMSPADIIAAARGGAAKSADPPATETPKVDKSKMSPADIIAAAKGGKSTPAKAESPKTPPKKQSAAKASPLDALAGKGKGKPGDPRKELWKHLPEDVKQTMRKVAGGASPTTEEKNHILQALNNALKDRGFVTAGLSAAINSETVSNRVRDYPKGAKGVKSDWSDLQVRAGARYALANLYSTIKDRAFLQQQPTTLSYLNRGEIFGEMGVITGADRSATCIAYDHPETKRKPGHVELVRISQRVFDELVRRSPVFKDRVDTLIESRKTSERRDRKVRPWDDNTDLSKRREYRDLGLVQGQKLLLVDLDRCTRCGDCVNACIKTHDDGFSRLFLDGPRIDRYLVPSSCRKCLNPACMIGCPVSSIEKGGDGQIVIRDWCIGCGTCANQCPYDSIQMHDLGVIPENAIGWKYAPASSVANPNWTSGSFRDKDWSNGVSPFNLSLALRMGLQEQGSPLEKISDELREAVYFRYPFFLEKGRRSAGVQFQVSISSVAPQIDLWINNKKMELGPDGLKKKRTINEFKYYISAADFGAKANNLLAVCAHPGAGDSQAVLTLRMDVAPERVEDATGKAALNKLVTDVPVVCDLCSSLPSKEPACVVQCPHDAAFRVDARVDLASMR